MIDWMGLGVGIMCPSGARCLSEDWFFSVRFHHYKHPTQRMCVIHNT